MIDRKHPRIEATELQLKARDTIASLRRGRGICLDDGYALLKIVERCVEIVFAMDADVERYRAVLREMANEETQEVIKREMVKEGGSDA